MSSPESRGNLFAAIPGELPGEIEEVLLAHRQLSIRRILSKGQASPAQGWYDQQDNEWVLVLQGEGILAFSDGEELHLEAGDYCFIPAHRKHRVKWTPKEQVTVWLAVHFPTGDNSE